MHPKLWLTILPYSFYLVFEPPCQIEGAEFDVETTEAVILLHKTSASQGEWSHFKAGVSLNDLQVGSVLTNIHAITNRHIERWGGQWEPSLLEEKK